MEREDIEPEVRDLLAKSEAAPPALTGGRSRHVVLAALGFAACCALAALLLPRQPASPSEPETVEHVLQRDALETVGHGLSPAQLSHAQERLRRLRVPMGAPARALGDVEMDDLFEDEEVKELLDKIGGECKDALKKHILDTIEEVLVTVILKELFCWLDEKGDDCIEYKKKLDKKLTTMKAECKKRGEVCNATESFPVSKSEYNKTTVKDCLPLVCHDKVPLASIFLEKVLNEMSDRCKENKFGKCKLSLHCASGHKSLDA